MIFKYREYREADGKTIYRPTIPIIFKNGKYFAFLEAVIDSGADYIILPIEMAGQLNLKLESKTEFYAAGGNRFTVYKSPIELEYIIRKDGYRNITTKTTVYFAESQPAILLGHHGFLQKLKITLNGPKKEVEIAVE
jgi:predicted aspartyl protease